MTDDRLLAAYHGYTRRKWIFIAGTALALLVFIAVGITLGAADVSITEAFKALLGMGESWQRQIIWQIRLPRVLAAVLAGVALASAGSSMQSILRNPLGSPFTLGIASAAAFGAAFAVIVLGAGSVHSSSSDAVILNNPYLVTISAFLWCLIATFVILVLARLGRPTPETLVLAGIALGSLFSAGFTALEYVADEVQLASVIFWTFGDLGKATWRDFGILAAAVVPVTAYFVWHGWTYNALDGGDELARSMGISVDRIRTTGMVLASLVTALVVSFFGIIGFVGLVVPHIVRRSIGGDERYLIAGSAVFGGAFLLMADTVARTVISPLVLPVGILTSFLGAPLFIYLLVKGRRYW